MKRAIRTKLFSGRPQGIATSFPRLALNRPLQPRAGERPVSIGRSRSHSQRIGDFRDRHPDEITELDHLGGHTVFSSQRIQGIMHGEDFGGGSAQFNSRFVEFLPRLTSAAIMLVSYAGYLALRRFVEDPERRGTFNFQLPTISRGLSA